VGEPGGPEVVGQLGRLLAVVTQHHPEEQRPVPDGEVGGAGLEGAAHAVGQAVRGGGLRVGSDVVDGEPSDDAASTEPGNVGRRWSLLADQLHPLAGEAVRQLAGGAPVGRRLQPAPVEADVDAHAAGDRLRVAGQRHPPRHRARRHRVEPGARPIGEGGAEQGEGNGHQPRSPGGDGERGGDGTHRERRPAAAVHRQRHHDRHGDCGPVAHRCSGAAPPHPIAGRLAGARAPGVPSLRSVTTRPGRASGRAWRHRCR
jgi:hypothetical protein